MINKIRISCDKSCSPVLHPSSRRPSFSTPLRRLTALARQPGHRCAYRVRVLMRWAWVGAGCAVGSAAMAFEI